MSLEKTGVDEGDVGDYINAFRKYGPQFSYAARFEHFTSVFFAFLFPFIVGSLCLALGLKSVFC